MRMNKRFVKETYYVDSTTGYIYSENGLLLGVPISETSTSLITNKINFEDSYKNHNKFEYLSWSAKDFDLPTRATTGSAGYDFHSPVSFVVKPGETVEISLEVKVSINFGEFLLITPRSSLGFKGSNHVSITNTVGVIDSDYYNNEVNEGEIKARFHNFGTEDFVVNKNDRVLQGIFMKYGLTCDDNVSASRTGGFGSSGN